MSELRLEYKRDTGQTPDIKNGIYCDECDTMLYPDDLYKKEYVEWLENKIKTLQNENS